MTTGYRNFLKAIRHYIPKERIYIDDLRCLAWGTDAGFYKLVPRIVIRSVNENEISELVKLASKYQLPITFRAAGTSLSGQAISDSILVIAGKYWENYSLSSDYSQITMQPGLTGNRLNSILAKHNRKFGPDPASINSAMVGGIIMNNASGMCCGVHANSDKEMVSAKIVLADGFILDTNAEISRENFKQTHRSFIKEIENIREEILTDKELVERIRYKYSIKNVTGLNLNPFVCYKDPFDIIAHLMVGSEGTLAFLSQVTMKTQVISSYSASAMIYFDNMKEAASAVVGIRSLHISAAELLDEKSLASVNDKTGVGLTAILVRTEASSKSELQQNISEIENILYAYSIFQSFHFTENVEEYSKYWAIRSGIFPSVGGTRKIGTTCLIEDIAFHIEDLPQAIVDLDNILKKYGYNDSCIYGHALEGNFHFIINQSFDTKSEIKKYKLLIQDVVRMVVEKYDGSLKAEHGTGRNMAPFVKYEWGEKAYSLMVRIKKLFDPENILNPGVIFNDDPLCYLKNFKSLPLLVPEGDLDENSMQVYAKLNKCIECGFCEINCLTCGFTLSPRTRIVAQREIAQLRKLDNKFSRLIKLQQQFNYLGNETCAGDGLCAISCPMGISTADLTHEIRRSLLPSFSTGYIIGYFVSKHFKGAKNIIRGVLKIAELAHMLLGTKIMSNICRYLHKVFNVPLWTSAMPKSYKISRFSQKSQWSDKPKVVYFPSCINQSMGLMKNAPVKRSLVDETCALLHKAGYEIIFPESMESMCCGTIWESKGLLNIANRKTAELETSLRKASNMGEYPVLCDQSPCLHRMQKNILTMKLYEPAEFIYLFLRDRLKFKQMDAPIALHLTCSTRLMGVDKILVELAKMCSSSIFIPEEIGCCGFAGDKGFTYPEVNAYALRKLRPQIEEKQIKIGYSNSRTCEIGLTTNSGIPYVSIVYLVNQCTLSLK